jgi:hypothetical protein
MAIFNANPWGLRRERDAHWILAAGISHRLMPEDTPWLAVTSPIVHLEFPTQKIPSYARRGPRGPRRGDVDVVVFGEPFTHNRLDGIYPRVLIELGLDAPPRHVHKDVEKIADWVSVPDGPIGFLGHLFRTPAIGGSSADVHRALLEALGHRPEVQGTVLISSPTVLLAKIVSRRKD